MAHILVAGALHPSGRALLDASPHSVRYIDEISEPSYAPHIAEANALVIRTQPLSAATVARAERLRIVSRHGVGYDAVDLAALNARGITLAVCGDVNSHSVAEHTVMMILAAMKRIRRADQAVRSGDWGWRNGLESQDLRGRCLLILGYGRIGQRIAALMAGFGMTLRAYDPFATQWPGGAERVSDLTEALGSAQVVAVSVPKGDRPLIGPAEFAAMADGTVLVNCARGGIVDEAALVQALVSGRIGAAGLDVFDAEPLPADHPLNRFDQVILSPHIAGVTEGASERMAIGSAQNVLDFFEGRLNPDLIVNSEAQHGPKT